MTSEPKRVCQVIEVKEDALEVYKDLHANAWPEILSRLRSSNISDYSINFLPSPPYPTTTPNIGGLLIATFKYTGTDWDGDMRRIGEDESTKRWWFLTDSMQRSLIDGAKGSGKGPWWLDCEEVFRME